MKTVLFVDGCVSNGESRTERLALAYLMNLTEYEPYQLEHLVLEEAGLAPLDHAALKKRDFKIQAGDFSDESFRFAKSFASASEVVIAVPYWDLSFPSILKVYLEHLCISGLTFRYTENGIPEGLTQVQKVTYITTSGGYIGDRNFGYDYVKAVMQGLFSIPDVRFISAEGLDIAGNHPGKILNDAIRAMTAKNVKESAPK